MIVKHFLDQKKGKQIKCPDTWIFSTNEDIQTRNRRMKNDDEIKFRELVAGHG